MDDMTVYKRDKKGKDIASNMNTRCTRVTFQGTDVELRRTIKIGRDEKNDIVIRDDQLVSRRHAVIEQDGDKLFLQDKDSTNGTYVNNNPVPKGAKVLLKCGDVISVGKTKLTVK